MAFIPILIVFMLLLGGIPAGLHAQTEKPAPAKSSVIKEKDLAERYREWLRLVSYIILPVEKEVFMKLATDRDRDIFVESFWKQRDPTPSTPQNEYKDEHIKRFAYANMYYRRGTPREGWMTDMGRMHIILGPPASIERFEGVAGIHPCQVWYYRGEKEKRLPAYFGLVFFKRGGSGEFKLYNPTSDGPGSLLVDTQGVDLTNGAEVYQKIKDLAPTLAGMSISMIPGEYPYAFTPSPQINILMAEIIESPKKDISPAYATHFLDYKGIVSTEYLTNYIESSAEVAVVRDAVLDIPFVHFSMAPKKLSIDYYEPNDQYYCNFKLSVSLRKGDRIIFQYSKDFPFYFPPANVDGIRANGVAVQDVFPAIEGTYGLSILLQNAVGKEFSLFEKEITIPGEAQAPAIAGFVLGYKLQDYKAGVNAPFKFQDKQLVVDAKSTMGLSDEAAFAFDLVGIHEELWKEGRVLCQVIATNENGAVKREVSLPLSSYPRQKVMGITQAIPVRDLSPDYYELKLRLVDGAGKLLDEKRVPFIVSPAEAVPHPVTLSKTFPVSNSFLYYYAAAYQYAQAGLPEQAEKLYKRAYSANPDYKEGLVDYALFLLMTRKYREALVLSEGLKDTEKFRFDHFLIKGQAQAGLGDYGSAIASLLEGNKIYNSDTRLLNSLGRCYLQTGDKTRAFQALKASLSLNPDQKDIQDLVRSLEK